MQQYLFRAKVLYNGNHYHSGEWVYGYYWTNELGNHFIRRTNDKFGNYILEDVEVDPETVGQYTGLNDKNNKLIYNGDVLKAYKHNEHEFIRAVIWRHGSFIFGAWFWHEFKNIFRNIEVMGNVYDNPELINIKL